jgi:hypothetical protein
LASPRGWPVVGESRGSNSTGVASQTMRAGYRLLML